MAVPTLTSAEILATGNGRTLRTVWSENVTYLTGQVTAKATALFGQTAKRSISSTGTPTVNNDTVDFTLQVGKPVNQGESGVTVSIPAGTVQSVSTSDPNGIVTDAAMTNNSAQASNPCCRIAAIIDGGGTAFIGDKQEYTGVVTVEVTAGGPFGISSVDIQVDDGTSTVGPVTVTARSKSTYDGYRLYRAELDLGTFAGGAALTFTATARMAGGMGTRVYITTGFKADGSRVVYHVAASGNDTTGNGTEALPWATIGKAVAEHRNAVNNAPSISINEAGAYTMNAGFTGGTYTPTRIMRFFGKASLGPSDVVIQNDPGSGQIQSNGITSSAIIEFSHLKLDMDFQSDIENQNRVNENAVFRDCIIAKSKLAPSNVSQKSPYDASKQFWHIGSIVQKTQQGISLASMARNVLCEDIAADMANQLLGAVNIRARRRGTGRIAFTIVYTGTAGAATVEKIGNHAAGSFVLNVPGRPTETQTYDLTNIAYDTFTELVAAINTDHPGVWSAILVEDVYPSDFIRTSPAIDAKGSTVTVWQASDDHRDLSQWFGNATYTNVIVDGVDELHPNTASAIGQAAGTQLIYVDHTGPPIMEGLCLLNISSPTFNAASAGQSQFYSTVNDCLVMFLTHPDSVFSIRDDTTPFTPRNVVFGYSIFETFGTSSADKEEVYFVELHLVNAAPVLGAGDVIGSLTIGAVDNEFVSYVLTQENMHPVVGGVFTGRVNGDLSGLGALDGNPRSASTAIGAYEILQPASVGGELIAFKQRSWRMVEA